MQDYTFLSLRYRSATIVRPERGIRTIGARVTVNVASIFKLHDLREKWKRHAICFAQRHEIKRVSTNKTKHEAREERKKEKKTENQIKECQERVYEERLASRGLIRGVTPGHRRRDDKNLASLTSHFSRVSYKFVRLFGKTFLSLSRPPWVTKC